MKATMRHSARSKYAERNAGPSSKSEARNPKEIRSPKGASLAAPARRTHASLTSPDQPVLRSTRTEIAVRSGATAEGGPTRISDFGLVLDFGFRPSDFPQTVSRLLPFFSESSLAIRRLRRVSATEFRPNTTATLSSLPRGRRRIRRCSAGSDAGVGHPSSDQPKGWR